MTTKQAPKKTTSAISPEDAEAILALAQKPGSEITEAEAIKVEEYKRDLPSVEVVTLTETQLVLLEVEAERKSQDGTWGEQNHPLGGGQKPANALSYYGQQADSWKTINDNRVGNDELGWDGILLEEVFEALAESDPERARSEYLQVAAVSVAAIESIDRANA